MEIFCNIFSGTHHLNHGNWEQYTILGTFRGDVGDTVRTLTERQELNDFAVALSAMGEWLNVLCVLQSHSCTVLESMASVFDRSINHT